jgi:ribosomal-protein-alanine N-acetyltransferase
MVFNILTFWVYNMQKSNIFSNLPLLETKRLRLRKLSSRDANDIYEYASLPEVAENVSWEHHRNISDSIHFLKMIISQYENCIPSPWGIVYKENSKLIGTIGYHIHSSVNFFAEVGYALSKDYWNMGIMTEALLEVLDFGFSRMNLNRIEATCMLNNAASEKVLKKCGMKYEGIMKQKIFAKEKFHDLKLFAVTKGEFNNLTNKPVF